MGAGNIVRQFDFFAWIFDAAIIQNEGTGLDTVDPAMYRCRQILRTVAMILAADCCAMRHHARGKLLSLWAMQYPPHERTVSFVVFS
ncbi:hypothetical protein UNDKW_1978 [Undibacterium sp. KW1]|uniref:hypothetical protein n=1 Tax=Undibacterium sp. KW1 TaxID=2058624 RepID=UPI001331D61C|nr:hypothetical protein [Undibacterium sp. KW1]BBB60251.1 hypothetical protein UNDKW_1978 [Undibacterium sp. KW1]